MPSDVGGATLSAPLRAALTLRAALLGVFFG